MAALLAVLSSVVWGTADFLGGTLSRRCHPVAVLAGSQPFGLLIAIVAAAVLGQWRFDAVAVSNGVIAGVLGLGGLIAFYSALSAGRMGIVSPISATGVIIPLAIGLLRGDQPRALQYVGIVVTVAGVVMASGPELSGGAEPRPVILAVVAAALFGAAIFFMARGAAGNPSITVVTMRLTQVSILTLAALAARRSGGLNARDMPMLMVMGSADALANVLYTSAAAVGLLSVISVLGSLFPVVTVILAWRFHGERLVPIQYIGTALTLAGVLAITAG